MLDTRASSFHSLSSSFYYYCTLLQPVPCSSKLESSTTRRSPCRLKCLRVWVHVRVRMCACRMCSKRKVFARPSNHWYVICACVCATRVCTCMCAVPAGTPSPLSACAVLWWRIKSCCHYCAAFRVGRCDRGTWWDHRTVGSIYKISSPHSGSLPGASVGVATLAPRTRSRTTVNVEMPWATSNAPTPAPHLGHPFQPHTFQPALVFRISSALRGLPACTTHAKQRQV